MAKFLIQLIIEIFLIILLYSKAFISNEVSLVLIVLVLLLFLIESILINKGKHTKARKVNDIIFIIVVLSLLLILNMYTMIEYINI